MDLFIFSKKILNGNLHKSLMETFIFCEVSKPPYSAQKMKFSLKDFFSKCGHCGFGLFTDEIFNGKFHFENIVY